MRGQVALALVLAACGVDERAAPMAAGRAYAEDPAVGRAALEASLVAPDNGYGRLRLERYRPDDWGALPEWAPRVAPVRVGEPPGEWRALPTVSEWDADAVREAGARAFVEWPAQIVPALAAVVTDTEAAARVGLRPDPQGRLPLVWVDLPAGPQPALTCATCHGGPDAEGRPVLGRPSGDFDYLALFTQGIPVHPGRVDVTADGMENPTAITDLRPIRRQLRLHRAATLHNGLLPLAVRIETLLITAYDQRRRPPRAVAFALSWFLWGLADAQPPVPEGPGAAVFARTCAGCHAGDDLTGPPVALAAIGTPDAVGRSPTRGTGTWRVPSLRGVGDRRPLLASGLVPDLEVLLDPAREVPGHRFGLDLPAAERVHLLSWLRAL